MRNDATRNDAHQGPFTDPGRGRQGLSRAARAIAGAMACLASAGAPAVEPEAAGPIAVSIDVLPGESANIVDGSSSAPVPVAILGAPALDVRSIDPLSLRLARSAVVKNHRGETHAFEDVNGDGLEDLIVWFSARALQLADTDRTARLDGSTRGGARIEGTDAVLTLAAALRDAGSPRPGPGSSDGLSEEKLPPLTVTITALPEEGGGDRDRVAILGSRGFDPRDVALDTIRIDGRSVTKAPGGEVALFQDVTLDGREDLVVSIPSRGESPASDGSAEGGSRPSGGGETFTAATCAGRLLRGATAEEAPPAPPPPAPPPSAAPPPAVTADDGASSPNPSIPGAGSASNPVSKRLAVRLGYRSAGECEVLLVR